MDQSKTLKHDMPFGGKEPLDANFTNLISFSLEIVVTPDEVADQDKVSSDFGVEGHDVVEKRALQTKLFFGRPFPQTDLKGEKS